MSIECPVHKKEMELESKSITNEIILDRPYPYQYTLPDGFNIGYTIEETYSCKYGCMFKSVEFKSAEEAL